MVNEKQNNNATLRQLFRCTYCGKAYFTAGDRARCEISCEAEKKKREEEERRKQFDIKKEENLKVIKDKFTELSNIIEEFSQKYNNSDDMENLVKTLCDSFSNCKVKLPFPESDLLMTLHILDNFWLK